MYKFFRIIISSLFLCVSSVYADIERVSLSSNGVQGNDISLDASLNSDGRFVVFTSGASNLVDGDSNNDNDVFLRDRQSGLTERVSVSSTGEQANDSSGSPSISSNGRFIAFSSRASNLVASDNNNDNDVFVHDRQTGLTERVSVSSTGEQANDSSSSPSISADGRFVAFLSRASNLVAGGINGVQNSFVHDRITGVTEIVSISSTSATANANTFLPKMSGSGRFVVFSSAASNLVDGDINGEGDIFVHDRQTGFTELASVSSTGMLGNGNSFYPSISTDGQFVMFSSTATNLVDVDINGLTDVFVHDRNSGLTEIVSVSSTGVQGNGDINLNSIELTISADGQFVTFSSASTNLVDNDDNGETDIFVHDRLNGITEIVSVTSSGVQGDNFSIDPALSADGRFVAFFSASTNLVDANTSNFPIVLVANNTLATNNDDLSVTLRTTSGAISVGEYIQFRARLENKSDTTLTNCTANIINPRVNSQREFSYFSWPLNVANPVANGAIDIAPGETGQISLAVLPRVAMRREVRFEYLCDKTKAFAIPFINTIHLTAKIEPLIDEDYVQLQNGNNRTALVIDRNNGKYWTGYTARITNTGSQPTSVNLTTTSDFPDAVLRQSRLCEPIDPDNGNWSCSNPRDTQLQVELTAGETKRIRVFVHARQAIDIKPARNRIILEALDSAGEIVSKTSMGISTIN